MNETSSSRTGEIIISSNDVSNSPQVISIIQSSNSAPEISDIYIELGTKTDNIVFNNTDFTSHFSDRDNNTLKSIKIISSNSGGKLMLNNSQVVSFQIIPENEIKNLYFIPDADWDGSLNIEYNASDGVNFAMNNAFIYSHITGIADFMSQGSIKIYPNPTDKVINIEFSIIPKEYFIELYNNLGQVVLTKQSANQNEQLNVEQLVGGIYYLRITSEKYKKSEKILVQ